MMLEITLFQVLMAVALAVIIIAISIVKNPVIKSLVYGLPIPATLALIATQKEVDATHVIGLFLIVLFIWSVHWLKQLTKSIVVADLFGVGLYVLLGYFLVTTVNETEQLFLVLTLGFTIAWLVFVLLYPSSQKKDRPAQPKMHPLKKGPLVFALALLLLSFKSVLMGVVVLFPFSGIFTVVEMRDDLNVLASEFTKNSISILVFLMINHYAYDSVGFYPAIAIGWIGCIVTLKIVRMVRPSAT